MKKTIIANVAESDYNDNLAIYARTEANLRKINAEMDVKINKIREQYSTKIDELTECKESSFEVVMKYAEENPQIFGKKRSLETVFGVIGFRMGTPKLKNLKGFTWASITSLWEELYPEYVRIKKEPNKEAVLANDQISDSELKKMGVEIVQDDTFYIDIKTEIAD